jgi:hypothetical protein
MFENLNNANSGANNPNQEDSSKSGSQALPQQPEVDDIFAETDKVSEDNSQNQPLNKKSEIVTKHVGLGASSDPSILNEDEDDDKKGGKIFTIIVVVMVVVIVGLLGFLVYSKFFQPEVEPKIAEEEEETGAKEDSEMEEEAEKEDEKKQEAASEEEDEFLDYVSLVPGEEEPESDFTDEDLEGELINEDTNLKATIDSDKDGLTDEEELLYNTNPLNPDTDGDGLSDYEEVKIYNTDPLNPDTDGDGYLDGEEVNNGYNPNGPGKLSDKQ